MKNKKETESIINYKLSCSSKDEEKLKLILLFNETSSKFVKGFKNYKKLFDETKSLENELKQIAFNDEVGKTENIGKRANLILKKEKLDKWRIAIESLEINFTKLGIEIEEKAWYATVTDVVDDAIDDIGSFLNLGKYMTIGVGFILVGGLAMLIFNIAKQPAQTLGTAIKYAK
jgi:hypothetical protein